MVINHIVDTVYFFNIFILYTSNLVKINYIDGIEGLCFMNTSEQPPPTKKKKEEAKSNLHLIEMLGQRLTP